MVYCSWITGTSEGTESCGESSRQFWIRGTFQTSRRQKKSSRVNFESSSKVVDPGTDRLPTKVTRTVGKTSCSAPGVRENVSNHKHLHLWCPNRLYRFSVKSSQRHGRHRFFIWEGQLEDKVLRTVEKHPLSFDSLKKTPVTGRRENCRQVRCPSGSRCTHCLNMSSLICQRRWRIQPSLKAQIQNQQLEEELKQQKAAACFEGGPNTTIYLKPFCRERVN